MSGAIVVGTLCFKFIAENIVFSIKSIHDIFSYLNSSKHHSIKESLEDLDIKEKIIIVETLLSELKSKQIKKSVKHSVNSVGHSIEEINHNLKKLKDEIEYHNTKYFSNWRTFNYDDIIENLKKKNNLLNCRLDLLIKLLSIK